MSRILALAATLLLASALPVMAAPAATIAQPQVQNPAAAVADKADKAACGVMLMIVNEAAARYPQMFGKGSDARTGQAMFRMAAQGGKSLFDQAVAEGAANGQNPSDVYQAAVASMFDSFKGVSPGSAEMKQRGAALAGRCMELAAPKG